MPTIHHAIYTSLEAGIVKVLVGKTQTVATLVTGWHHWDNDSVETWAQSNRAALTAGSSTVVIQGPPWESWVAGVSRRAGWVMAATVPAYKDKDPTASSVADLL